jgi:hypothetical protein
MNASVKFIRDIRISRPGDEPELMAVKANGIAEIRCDISPALIPKKYTEAPHDGIMELDFILVSGENNHADVEMEVDIVFKVKDLPPWVKGLKINASENSNIELL